MATFIVETLTNIDTAIMTYAENVFTGVGGQIRTVIIAGGLVALPLIAINSIFQFRQIALSQYITWFIRYVIILAVATTWTQFEPIFNILTQVPNNYGATLLSAAGFGSPNPAGLNGAMDEMVTGIFDFSDRANEESGFFSISLTAVILLVLGALMACVAIIVSAIAKIGLALAISIGPLAIASMMFRATSQFFESWTRFTLGFALIPLVLAGVMGAVIGIGQNLIATSTGATEISEAAGFIIVVLAAIFLMYQIPTIVSGLAGSIVASAGAGFVAGTAGSAFNSIRGGASRVSAAAREVRNARSEGGTRGQQASAAIAGLRQASFVRDQRREQFRLNSLERSSPSEPRTTPNAQAAAASAVQRAGAAQQAQQASRPPAQPAQNINSFTSPRR